MRKRIAAPIALLFFVLEIGIADTEANLSEAEAEVLRSSFEKPLQAEFLRKGFSPRNADIATRNMLKKLIECWGSERNRVANEEQQAILVSLGDSVIATYPSPCIDDLLTTVNEVTR